MWETFRKVRNRLTPAEWDQVFLEIKEEKDWEETRDLVAEFTNQVKGLQGHPIDHRLKQMFDLLCLTWQKNMLLRGYMFTYQLDTPDLFYREFSLGGRVYSLMIAFINNHQNIEIRFR